MKKLLVLEAVLSFLIKKACNNFYESYPSMVPSHTVLYPSLHHGNLLLREVVGGCHIFGHVTEFLPHMTLSKQSKCPNVPNDRSLKKTTYHSKTRYF